jgi:filamentous hemagglutinin family protein
MNHVYRLIWNTTRNIWMVAPENAKSRGKRGSGQGMGRLPRALKYTPHPSPLPHGEGVFIDSLVLAITTLLYNSPALALDSGALPTGGHISAGSGSISHSTNQLTIQQDTARLAANWQSFDIGQHARVQFNQPSASSVALNRVTGQNASDIQGRLDANGQVYLLNSNGIVFGKTAQVNVGALVATTHQLSDADFMARKAQFTNNASTAHIVNQGQINAKDGIVALIANTVDNQGSITAPKGDVVLAAGKKVSLDFDGDGLIKLEVDGSAVKTQIHNKGLIQADGAVIMTAKAANALVSSSSVVNNEGIVEAMGLAHQQGRIVLEGNHVNQPGTLDASGGSIDYNATDAIVQTSAASLQANGSATGGKIHLQGNNSLFSSAKATATGAHGGSIRVGGDFHGTNPNILNAKTTTLNGAAHLKADGGNGTAVVWSDQQTDYYGNISANKAGSIEVSSKGTLHYAGTADAGVGGSLLLDPTNIVILAAGSPAAFELLDPHPAVGNLFGQFVTRLGTTTAGVFTASGKAVVAVPTDGLAATNAGAAYLFDTNTGALVSSLVGSTLNDVVGSGGITALSNGNFVVRSTNWDNATVANAGAVTWGSGTAGVEGAVSATNSLVGSASGDQVGGFGITALTNGNYVVGSASWDNGAVVDAGAATWGSGTAGVVGAVSVANSLVGSHANDLVGSNGITALSNGNYVVARNLWDNCAVVDAGAATWGSGMVGVAGAVSATNSLVGSTSGDQVGGFGITALTNGNYVVASNLWDNGVVANASAVTWGSGTVGVVGTVSTTNSLVGTAANDQVGSSGVNDLFNGNYLVRSSAFRRE